MARTSVTLRQLHRLSVPGLALALIACGDDDGITSSSHAADSGARYVIESMITGDSDRASYVAVLPTLDRTETVEFSDAREFAAYAPADAWKGTLLVNDGEAPKVTQYKLDGDDAWSEGETLFFSDETSLPLERNIAVADDKAYVPFDRNNFVVWNPDTFDKGEELGAPVDIPQTRDDDHGLTVSRGYSFELRGTTLFQPYYYADATYKTYSQESKISVIDTQTDKVTKVLTAPCPHMHITTRDKAGNIYVSNGMGSIPAAMTSGGKLHNCFVKISAGSDDIDASATTDFRELADGREGSNLYVISDKLALFNVYHAERDKLGDQPDFDDVDKSENYHLWTLDLETQQAKIMEGIDYSGGQVVVFPIDDRVFVTVPAPDYSSTQVFEVSPEGAAKKLFDVNGWAFKMFRLR